MFFICRNPHCRKFMRAERWLWDGGKFYYCPMCFHQYRPWKEGKMADQTRWVPAQKIMVIEGDVDIALLSGVTEAREGLQPPAGLDQTADKTAAPFETRDGFSFYLCEWPMTVTQQLINDLKASAKEVRAFCASVENNMETLESKIVEFAAGLSSVKFMEEVPVANEIIQLMDWQNQSGGHWLTKPLKSDHMPKNELGQPLTSFGRYEYDPEKTKILTIQEQIRMWAFCSYQVAARRKLRELAETQTA